jgi:hypothetical protein
LQDNDPTKVARILLLSSEIKEFTVDAPKALNNIRKHTDHSAFIADQTLPLIGRDLKKIAQM